MERRRQNVEIFTSQDGKAPFEVWFHELRDSALATEVLLAIEDLKAGRFDQCRSIGCGVFEKRISLHPPLRLFFALVGREGLLLLTGSGDHSKKDSSENALKIWKEFKEHAH